MTKEKELSWALEYLKDNGFHNRAARLLGSFKDCRVEKEQLKKELGMSKSMHNRTIKIKEEWIDKYYKQFNELERIKKGIEQIKNWSDTCPFKIQVKELLEDKQ